MTKRNLSQTQINRRKRAGAELTRTSSGLSLASVGLLGVAAATRKNPGKLNKIPGLKNANAHKIRETAQNVGLISGGIAGLNGFNNASWQSAEARQRKAKPVTVTASKSASPFEEGTYGEIGKALVPAMPPKPEAKPKLFQPTTGQRVALARAGYDKEQQKLGKALSFSPGMGAMRPSTPSAAKFKPLGQRPVSANVKNMRKVPLANGGGPSGGGGGVGNTAGLSGVGKSVDFGAFND